MYEKVSTNLNFVDREKKTEEFWKENDTELIRRMELQKLSVPKSGSCAAVNM